MLFTAGVGEKERNSTKIKIYFAYSQGGSTFFLMFFSFFYLSIITAYQTYSLAARFLFVCVANMFTLMIKLELKAS